VRFAEFLLLTASFLIPLLVFGFCWWRAVEISQLRTPRNSRLLARKVTPLIVVNLGIAIVVTLLGLVPLVAMVVGGDKIELEFFGLLALGVLLGILTTPLFKIQTSLRTELPDDDPVHLAGFDQGTESAGISLWTILCALGIVIAILGVFLGFGFLILSVLIFGLIPVLFWQRRRAREGQLLWLLALSVRNGHDLPRQIQDHAATWAGSYAIRLRQLAARLRAGQPLGIALSQIPGLLPCWVIASIRIGDETGTLSAVLGECATTQLNWMKERFRTGSIGSLLIYLACYPWVILAPVSFTMYYIVPKFKAIFEGFGTELPGVTENFIRAYDTWIPWVSLLAPFSFIAVLLLLRFDHSGWRNVRTRLFWRLYPRYDASPIMRHLARMIEKGKTLPDSLLAIANLYHRPSIAESVAEVYVATESGGDCWESLLRQGFLSRRDLALIAAAQRVDNLPWALREIADVREKRYVFRVDTTVQFFSPIPILAVGAIVAWVCIALFLPVVKLANDLSKELP
jgi:type II secretory pathway component PulF